MTHAEPHFRSPAAGLEILHRSVTEIGELLLRKRRSIALDRDVYEMTMDGKLMMSDAVVDSERALASVALAELGGAELSILVGGLGFGFTAMAALEDQRVADLLVVERLPSVVDWHRNDLFPWSKALLADGRLRFAVDDFFSFIVREANALATFDAIVIDIDDSPDLVWHPTHTGFYEVQGLEAILAHLRPEGVLALWCAERPNDLFLEQTAATFAATKLVEVHFENPCLHQAETNYILLATAHRMPSAS